ncbi:molybdopterin-guanine dinucleotide biosynthesis protein B [Psychrobacillus sp. INOP01]|uniref:molybdopterin-guanine dinucleotide biosynthesis protein B n=1 Tax=Psychrobacillus sp. INOP01 TaxID=2829187 RepID=UPI001BA4FC30|nr:molybdopterin-guanine dinucleotide biosynthesis protein B [Psychrobacillus sp. INOP01]QUG41512.1 molybdopterin-guanine dinucleotide biosynthesis protein B [Psychrobacillus sp. INOP01]
MESVSILQVVGYKNSRKTTLIENWVKEIVAIEKEVAVIKHHGHASGLDLPSNETDSMKIFHSGATCSIAVDDQTIQMHQLKKEWKLEQLLQLVKISEPEVIFIEGYKQEHYHKVVILKDSKDWETLQHLKNIVCVIVHGDLEIENYPMIHIENTVLLKEWLIDWIGGDKLETI